jgi:magnesium transporter
MEWHEIHEPSDPELDRLAERYRLHPLHIEDCRHRNQRAKVENGEGYLFVVLKPMWLNAEESLEADDLDVFVGPDYIITVEEQDRPEVRDMLAAIRKNPRITMPDQVLYRVMDFVVDAYVPILDRFDDRIDDLEDEVLKDPRPESLARLFSLKRCLVDLRRIMVNMRDVANHLQRAESELIRPQMQPFYRDVYDHLARSLDLVEGQRDLLTGALDIYLSSVANRTNQAMRVLTTVGTVSLPILLVTSFYGMNVEGLPWAHAGAPLLRIAGTMAGLTVLLLGYLKLRRWL